MRIGVVIPAYNAAETLGEVVQRLRHTQLPWLRLWIVDDGSQDDTLEVARTLVAQEQRVEVLHLPRNRGYGAAMKRGLGAARVADVDVAACVHADGQYAPEALPALMEAFGGRGLDLLQGTRLASGGALAGGMPLYKYAAGRALTAMENGVLGLGLSDYHSGYLLHGRAVLAGLPFERLSDSFDFDLEVIASARARGLAVGEHPIPTHYGDEVSYLNPLVYGLRVLRVMARYMVRGYHPAVLANPRENGDA